MRTSVTVPHLINNAPIRPNREICIIDTHPGFFDAVSLTDLLSVATFDLPAPSRQLHAAGTAILPLLRQTYALLVAEPGHASGPGGAGLILADEYPRG